jgi:arylsulfatase A-like enzyme
MQPNILLVHVDQLRADVCGAYGSRLGLTPNLDYFAKTGCTFLSHCAINPVCTPNRAALFTGQYSTANGIWRNGMGFKPNQQTLVSELVKAGYETGYIGKWHLMAHRGELPEGHSYDDFATWWENNPDHAGPVPVPFRGGFQHWLGAELPDFSDDPWDTVLWDENNQPHHFPGYRVDAYTDCAIKYLSGREKSKKPFFLCVSYLEPHQQNNENWYAAVPALEAACRGLPFPDELSALQHRNPQVASKFAGYCGSVRKLDDAFGRLLDALKSLGLEENTLVIFTTDHGDHFGTRANECKRTCHDVSVRIPCIVRGGSFCNGQQIQTHTSTIDVLPTCLEMAEHAMPDFVQGRSMVSLAAGKKSERNEALIQNWGTEGPERGLRTDRYKITARMPNADWWYDFQGAEYQVTELYDLRADPYEMYNMMNARHLGGVGQRDDVEKVYNEMIQRLTAAMHEAGEDNFKIV